MQGTSRLMLLLVVGFCYARPEIDLSSAPANINLDDFGMLKERCEKKGKLEAYEKLKNAIPETRKCVHYLIDFTKIKDEVEESKKTGSMDEVFGKYCNRRPQFKECLEKSSNLAKECMEDLEKEALKFTEKIANEIGNFACLNDGDRIAMFVAEGGVECLSSRTTGIQKCVNETLKIDTSNLSVSNLTSASLPTSLNWGITQEKCNDLSKLQECVVRDLEDNCKDSTPANLVEAVFKFVKKTACKPKSKRNAIISRHFVKRQTESDMLHMMKTQLSSPVNYLTNICDQYGGVNVSKEFLKSVSIFTGCFKPQEMFLRTNKSNFFEKYNECISNSTLIESLENCLQDEAKYVPRFALAMVKSYVEFIYDHQDLMKVNKENMDIARCFQAVRVGENYEKLVQCAQDVRQFSGNNIPTKAKVCDMLATTNECIGNVITSVCVKDIKIYQIIEDLKETFRKPCRENTILAN